MSASEQEITGDAKHNILTTAHHNNTVQKLIEKFEEEHTYVVDQEVVTTVPEVEDAYIVTLVFNTGSETEVAEINVSVRDGQVSGALGTIDRYDGEKIESVNLYYVEDGVITTDSVRASSAASRSSGGIPCDLCKILYSKGKSIIQSGARNSFSPGYLCTQSQAKILQKLNQSAAQQCMNVSPNVVNYINTNGVTAQSSTACQNMNYCP